MIGDYTNIGRKSQIPNLQLKINNPKSQIRAAEHQHRQENQPSNLKSQIPNFSFHSLFYLCPHVEHHQQLPGNHLPL
jgi:hypothetical protein